MYNVTRAELIKQTKALFAEAMTLDPQQTDEMFQAVFGYPVFVWDRMTLQQLAALRRWCLIVRLSATE
jgi:hypothetical protein